MNIISNLLAFCLPILIFIFWGIVGYAALSILRTQRNSLQNILLAPPVGIAVTLLPVFWLNRAGLPVEKFAILFSLILYTLSIILLWWRKPLFPCKRYLPFAGIFFFALLLIGRPLLEFGFNWVSFGNDDMANYCLSASRFLHHGYTEIPNLNELIQGGNYSLFYWFLYVPGMTRSGADLLLAWLSAVTFLTPLQIFMPLILAFQLALISATGGLLYQSRRWRKAALLTCLLLSFSPLNSYGTLAQLIAQVGGIALLILATTLLLQAFTQHQKLISWRQSILISFTCSALLIFYPEVAPILGLSVLLYFIVSFLQGWRPSKTFWKIVGLCIFFSAVFLNTYWKNVIAFLSLQISTGLGNSNAEIFPYFLIPSGFADLWGFRILGMVPREPWQSFSIILGIFLTAFILSICVLKIRHKSSVAAILLIMIFLGIFLVAHASGFGTFKLAMYAQPFLIAMLVIGMMKISQRQRVLKIIFLSLFSLVLLKYQYGYVENSRGGVGMPSVELSRASQTHLTSELQKIRNSHQQTQALIADTSSIVTAKLMALYLVGKETKFYSRDFFTAFSNPFARTEYSTNSLSKIASQLSQKIQKNSLHHFEFALHDPLNPHLKNPFVRTFSSISADANFIASTPLRTIFNRRKFAAEIKTNFVILPWKNAVNYLIFTHSNLGQDYYLGENKFISLGFLLQDNFYKDKSFTSIGRYLLCQTVNPTPNARLEINLTQPLKADTSKLLPPAILIGKNREPFQIMGRGSARVFSHPINPQIIAEVPYVMLEIGTNVILNSRHITAYARDISLISDEEYKHLTAPNSLSNFPKDLDNPNLEYSGMYEDGWISEDAFFGLKQSDQKAKLLIKGNLPLINNNPLDSSVTVLVDGKKLATQKLKSGDFEITVDVPYAEKNRKVELHFAKVFSLSKKDGPQPIAAQIHFIGFEKKV